MEKFFLDKDKENKHLTKLKDKKLKKVKEKHTFSLVEADYEDVKDLVEQGILLRHPKDVYSPPETTPVEPYYDGQYYEKMGARDFWNRGFHGEGLNIAILDTGVDSSIPCLNGKIIYEKTYSDLSTSLDDKTYRHGSMCAGTLAGYDPVGGFYGIAYKANIINLKTRHQLDESFLVYQNLEALDDIISGAIPVKVDLISMSVGRIYGDSWIDAYDSRFATLRNMGILVCCAADNQGLEIGKGTPENHAPASCVNSLTIGALNVDNATRVNEVGWWGSNWGSPLDYAVQGTQVYSCKDGTYGYNGSGTSVATPLFVGWVALLKQAYNIPTTLEGYNTLLSTITTNSESLTTDKPVGRYPKFADGTAYQEYLAMEEAKKQAIADNKVGTCGIGMQDSIGIVTSVAGLWVNFDRPFVNPPESINLTTTSTNITGDVGADLNQYTQVNEHGFWLSIDGINAVKSYRYWRGQYQLDFGATSDKLKEDIDIMNGWCGVGGVDGIGQTSSVAGVFVEFKDKMPSVPTSIVLTPSSKNANALVTNITQDGFWLYVVGDGVKAYKYWRGQYQVVL